jgi:hypothetical protein
MELVEKVFGARCRRRASMVAILALGFLVASPPTVNPALQRLVIDTFEKGCLEGWIERRYRGRTIYKVVRQGQNNVLRAESQASASALAKIIRLNPKRFRWLEWRWKVEDIVEGGHALEPKAKDHAAGIYVLFARGRFPWQMDVIEYIWASKLPQGSEARHPVHKNVWLVAVESGRQHVRRWRLERRNLAEDYRRLFGGEPPPVVAVALMTDTDQTGARAIAYYDDLILRR